MANAGPGGVAAACAKAAARFPHPGAWRCVGDTAHWAGGVACCALMLVRVGGASGGAGASVSGSGAGGEGGVGGVSCIAGDACGDGGGGVPGASDAAGAVRAAAASEAEADVLHLKKVARRV